MRNRPQQIHSVMVDAFGELPAPVTNAPWNNVGGSRKVRAGEEWVEVWRSVLGDRPYQSGLTLCRHDEPTDAEDPNADDVDVPVIAKISFGAGQANETVFVDWLNGLQVSPLAGTVIVSAMIPENVGGNFDPHTTVRQVCSVMTSYGTRASSAGTMPQARLTTRLGEVAAAGTVGIVVPNRAHAFYLLTTEPDDYASYLAEFDTTQDPTTPRRVLAAMRPMGEEAIIPNGTRKIWFTNESADAADLTVIWSISL